jgi:hypothetical protein
MIDVSKYGPLPRLYIWYTQKLLSERGWLSVQSSSVWETSVERPDNLFVNHNYGDNIGQLINVIKFANH